jgi:hypothetical protein
MTKPIEIIHQNFEIKIKTIENILYRIDPLWEKNPNLFDKFDEIRQEYRENTVGLLCEYFDQSDLSQKCQVVECYMQLIVSKNFITRLNEFVLELKHEWVSKNASRYDLEMQLLFKTFNDTPIDTDVQRTDFKICPNCKEKMNIDPQHSELRCTKCDYTLLLKGTVFDESHMYTSEGTLSKRGAYETSRHCRYHLERILAIKNPNIPDSIWDKIRCWLRRNNFQFLKLVTYMDYRQCLKEIKETKYNEHVPFIRQSISGVSPERLFHSEIQLLYIYFDKAVTAFNKIKDGERANLKYYPYFIYKIVEMILNKSEDKKRLQSITDCIHFQRDNTIVANDRLWEQICEEVQEFTFKKTDKNLLFEN